MPVGAVCREAHDAHDLVHILNWSVNDVVELLTLLIELTRSNVTLDDVVVDVIHFRCSTEAATVGIIFTWYGTGTR